MTDLEFYQLSMTGAEADGGIRTGMELGALSGIPYADGNGGVALAQAGTDYGYPQVKGNGPPTANTAANIGQHYFDMSATQAPFEYICVGYNANGFVWIVFGDTGNGFKISGYFISLEALEAAISAGTVAQPTAGTAYGIGEAAPYDIYVWDAVNSEWVNNGPLGASGGGSGVPPHGTTGQVLTKLSDVDGDAGWKDVVARAKVEPDAPTSPDAGDFWFDSDEVNEFAVDNAPTQGSNNLVTSGGVATALDEVQADIASALDGKISITKLWENASPNSAFPAQTTALDLSDYDLIYIQPIKSTAEPFTAPGVIIGNSDACIIFSEEAGTLYHRIVQCRPTGIQYFDAVKYPTYGTTSGSTQANGFCIPRRIYGIKGVQS